MTMREDREREERQLAKLQATEPDKPVILSPEDVSTKLKEHDKRLGGNNGLAIAAIICSIVIPIIVALVALHFSHPKAATTGLTPSAVIERMTADSIATHDRLAKTDARVDSLLHVCKANGEKTADLTTLVESLHGRYDELKKDVYFFFNNQVIRKP